jgi:2-iminobutanoate/2-iminopropanoate deaminase
VQEIHTDDAPPSIGPFSQAIRSNGAVYVSGQGPIDPDTEEIVERDPAVQTRRTLENVEAILRAAELSLDDVVKATIFLSDMSHYEAVNEVYGEMLSDPYPARSAVEVVRLPVDILVEIEVVAEG